MGLASARPNYCITASIAAKVNYKEETEMVCLEFDKELSEGGKILKINYTGCLNENMRGFYSFRRGENMDPEAATMFEVCSVCKHALH